MYRYVVTHMNSVKKLPFAPVFICALIVGGSVALGATYSGNLTSFFLKLNPFGLEIQINQPK